MKSDGILKLALPIFLAALAAYAIAFHLIERRRVSKGPWRVTFEYTAGSPTLRINQPVLGITNVLLIFTNQPGSQATAPQALEFATARAVPFAVPFGQCVFQDTLFLPGTVALELFGHQIQLLPRVLTIDHSEHAWRSEQVIPLDSKAGRP